MKNLLLLPLLSIVSVGAIAQSTQAVDSVNVPANIQRIEVPARAYHMSQMDFGEYRGSYDLSNGQILTLSTRGLRMYAELDDGEKSEIVATGTRSFVATDQRLKMRFERQASGDLGGELLIAKSPQIAGQPIEYVTLATLR